jgi:hypothetical protein
MYKVKIEIDMLMNYLSPDDLEGIVKQIKFYINEIMESEYIAFREKTNVEIEDET